MMQSSKELELVDAEVAEVINILIMLEREMYPLQVPHKEIPQDQEMVLGEHLVVVAQAALAQVQVVMLIVALVEQADQDHQVQLQAHQSHEAEAAEAERLWPVVREVQPQEEAVPVEVILAV